VTTWATVTVGGPGLGSRLPLPSEGGVAQAVDPACRKDPGCAPDGDRANEKDQRSMPVVRVVVQTGGRHEVAGAGADLDGRNPSAFWQWAWAGHRQLP